MRCPKCGGETTVVNSRLYSEDRVRRRECRSCARRFSTLERVIREGAAQRCEKCLVRQPLSDFPPDVTRPKGVSVWCKECWADVASSRSS